MTGFRAGIEAAAAKMERDAEAHRRCLDGPAKLTEEDRQLHSWAAEVLDDCAERVRALRVPE